ncbi:glucose-1-phosphate thymidylyltransferase [Nocardiopsis metallicus]|uniref:Glucose-1-phosphate thymidylyltransferase n=1 Tax=Nocardiopsis metallicus TaxID=179819 RepID=A0A840WLD7_9ACTN|nr:glucose-1-phosphate thymidylyltransferase [Nocardiopsis metallicus]MBB5490918.1 glucose-1-phosphate thymidylyltransferase [Nocardiopsis metallicus]
MRALILAGGSGSRMLPLTHTLPKQLLPVAGLPVLEYAVRSVRDLGIVDIGVVTGEGADLVRHELGDGSELGVRITYIHQGQPRGLADCVRMARGFLGEEDFVLFLGDNLLPEGIGGLAEEFAARGSDAHVAVQRVADPSAFGVVETGEDGKVIRLVEKPREPMGNQAVIGVYFFTRAVHEAVRAIAPSRRGELEITDAVQWLLKRGYGVTASEYTGYWADVGRPEDVLAANRHVLGLLDCPFPQDGVDESSRVTGPVRLGRGASIVRSTVRGPVWIGPGTVVEDSAVGPWTSVGGGCSLSGADLADSVVLNGARVYGPAPLRGCLIGADSTVRSRPGPAGGHRFVVGDHTRIELGI